MQFSACIREFDGSAVIATRSPAMINTTDSLAEVLRLAGHDAQGHRNRGGDVKMHYARALRAKHSQNDGCDMRVVKSSHKFETFFDVMQNTLPREE